MHLQSDLITQINQLVTGSQHVLLNAANELVRYGKPLNEECVRELEETGCNRERCLDYLGLYIKIIKEYSECDAKEFCKRMLLLGYSEKFINNCVSKLSQLQLERVALFNKLTSFKWRLDVSFFDSKNLEKIPVPIIVSLKTSNGDRCVIELDRKAFHKLRFTVALLIKDLLNLKNLSSLKM